MSPEQEAPLTALREAAFQATIDRLPAPMRQTISESARRGESLSLQMFEAGWLAALAASERAQVSEPRVWPFVESPGAFTGRLRMALQAFDGDLLAAVRNVLIENPPRFAPGADSPEPARVLAWFVNSSEGRTGARADWFEVHPGDPMWSNLWTRYALVAAPSAVESRASSDPKTT